VAEHRPESSDKITMKFTPDNLIDVIVKPFNMRFRDEDEEAFRKAQNLEMRRHLAWVLSGLLFFGLFVFLSGFGGLADVSVHFLGLVAGALVIVAVPGDARHSQLLVATGSVIIQLVILWTALTHRDAGAAAPLYNFLVPCTLVHYMVLRLQFIPALISGSVCFAGMIMIIMWQQVPGLHEAFFIAGACNALGLFAVQRLEVMHRMNFKAIREINTEKAKTLHLVQRIIPDQLAERILHAPAGTGIEFFDEVKECTVLFVELTNCNITDRRVLFRIFDSIIGRATLEKIKTAENVMIVAGGLFNPDAAAEETLNVAVRMRQEVTQYNLDRGACVGFQAGIAAGDVSCGIIGFKVFAFDVWGLPVNLASRILQRADTGAICVTGEFVRSLRQGYHFSSRGRFDLKGIGQTEIFEFEKLAFAQRFREKEAA
jgi:class 3 adenylate cyclase